jgi:predicted ATPase
VRKAGILEDHQHRIFPCKRLDLWHWADPTSLEAFGRAVDRIANLPVLLLITFRPEFEPPWIGQSQVTALTLNRPMRREVDAMIDRIAANKLLSANIRQDIIERACNASSVFCRRCCGVSSSAG